MKNAKKRKAKTIQKPIKRSKPQLDAYLRFIQISIVSLFIFVLPLLLDINNTEYGYTKTIFAYIVVTLLYTLWGIQAWLNQEQIIHLPTMFWPGIVLLVAGGLSLINATSLGVGLQSLGVLFYFFLFYIYVANNIQNRRTLHLYLGVALLATLFVSLYGLLQYVGLLPGLPGVTGGKHAMISSMGNKNFLAEFLNSWFIPSLILLIGYSKWSKGLVLIVSPVAFAIFLVADSTGAMLGLVGGMVFLLMSFVFFRNAIKGILVQKVWVLIWILVLVVAFGVMNQVERSFDFALEPSMTATADSNEAARLNQAGLQSGLQTGLQASLQASLFQGPVQQIIDSVVDLWQQGSGDTRAWDWWVAYEMFKAQPLLGVGLGHYKVLFVDYKVRFLQTDRGRAYDFYIKRAAQAHSDYIQAAAEMGVVGIAAVLFALLTLAWRGIRQISVQTNHIKQFACLALYAGGLAFFIDALINFPAHLAASSFNLVLLLGFVHSPYLNPQIKRLRLKGAILRSVVIGFFILTISISVFAYRDWQANRHLDMGNMYLQSGLYRLAREEYERSLALDFQPAEVLFKLGVVSEALDERDQALKYYERSLQSFTVEEVFLPLARLKLQNKAYAEARDLLDRLILSKPSATLMNEAILFRALTEVRAGNIDEGIAQLEALKRENPNSEKVILGLAEAALLQEDFVQALGYYQAALEIVEADLASALPAWEQLQQQISEGKPVDAQEYSSLRSRIAYLSQQQEEIQKIIDSF